MRSKLPLFLFLSLFLASRAFALTVLKGSEASAKLGDLKQHFLQGQYTYDILSRSHRDSMHGRFSDGVIFNADGGLFKFLRRKEGDVDVILDSPEGRQTAPVSEGDWKKIQYTLSDDNPTPYLFLDDGGRELAAVFIGKGTKVDGKMAGPGQLEITIEVEGAKGHQNRRRGMS